jgi:glycosyltransferase involved in cell wall biosynthesis
MSQPIPLLFYVPYRHSLTGGPRVLLNLLTRLDRTQVQPIAVAQQESPFTDQLRQSQIETVIVPFPPILAVYHEGVFAYSLVDKLRSAKALLDYNQQIAEIGRRYQVQGIWGRNVKTILLVGMAARRLGVPLIWDIGMEKESRGLMQVLHWIGLSLATVVVTEAAIQPSQIFDPIAVKRFASKFIAIHPGIDSERVAALLTKPEPSPVASQVRDRFHILTVGTIHPRKNQLLLLRAIQDLVQRYPQLRISFVGAATDEAYFSACQQFVQDQALEPYVDFLGWREDIPALMQQADLFVLCSQNEGIPYVIHEAMHAAVPIIATAVGGIPEAIESGRTGFLVAKEDVTQLQQAIEHCLTHPDACVSVGQRAREVAAEKFSVTKWSSQYNSLLLRLCQA